MITTGKYVITYTGNGILRLPRAGIFQTGTRAVVDETVARIAIAHGCFAVVSMDAPVVPAPIPIAQPIAAMTIAAAPPPPAPPPPAPPAPEPVAAAPAPAPMPAVVEDKTRRPTRSSKAMRAVRVSEAMAAVADPTNRGR